MLSVACIGPEIEVSDCGEWAGETRKLVTDKRSGFPKIGLSFWCAADNLSPLWALRRACARHRARGTWRGRPEVREEQGVLVQEVCLCAVLRSTSRQSWRPGVLARDIARDEHGVDVQKSRRNRSAHLEGRGLVCLQLFSKILLHSGCDAINLWCRKRQIDSRPHRHIDS